MIRGQAELRRSESQPCPHVQRGPKLRGRKDLASWQPAPAPPQTAAPIIPATIVSTVNSRTTTSSANFSLGLSHCRASDPSLTDSSGAAPPVSVHVGVRLRKSPGEGFCVETVTGFTIDRRGMEGRKERGKEKGKGGRERWGCA